MGTHHFSGFKAQSAMAKFAPLMEFMSIRMCFVASAFWVFLYRFVLHCLPRFFSHGNQEIQDSGSSDGGSGNQVGKDSRHMLLSSSGENYVKGTPNHENGFEAHGGPAEKEEGSDSCFSEGVSGSAARAATTSKCQFLGSYSFSGLIEGPQTMSFSVQEMILVPNDDQSKRGQELSPNGNDVVYHESPELLSFDSIVDEGEIDRGGVPWLECCDFDPVEGGELGKTVCCSVRGESGGVEDESERQELDSSMQIVEGGVCREEEAAIVQEEEAAIVQEEEEAAIVQEEEKVAQGEESPSKENEFSYHQVDVKEQGSVKLSEHFFDFLNNWPEFDSDSDSSLVSSQSDEPETPSDEIDEEENREYRDHPHQSQTARCGDDPPYTEELFEPAVHESPTTVLEQDKTFVNDDYDHDLSSPKHHEEPDEGDVACESSGFSSNMEESETEEAKSSAVDMKKDEDDDEEMDGRDVLLEHMEYVKQMKKVMRQTKSRGLPTILEESESLPRMDQDLIKPLKMDDAKVEHKDRMDEIQTFYRSYMDKIRKLDILSKQTMYAIGVLQLKNPDHFPSNKKQSIALKKILANKLRLRHVTDPLHDSIRDLNKDLELVYVGQLCLSWEILRWEHGRAKELQLCDPDSNEQMRHRYNVVAEEFQQFEVLLQRFVEDEPYQGSPRVQNYIKNRTANCRFLQVPLIRADDHKQGQAVGQKGGGAVSISRLIEIIEESIHVLWLFLRADKDQHSVLPLPIFHRVDLQDPSNSELLAKIRTAVLKKERRLKDMMKSGNCLVNKFQKQQGRDSARLLSHEMVLAQIELRLVSRVMGMPSLTKDQVQWCHRKISKIKLVGRKVQTESSFLLFPC